MEIANNNITKMDTNDDDDANYTPYKEYPEFEIKGITFKYIIVNYDSHPILTICKMDDSIESGCGNPWNIVHDFDIRNEVLQMLPIKNNSPDAFKKPTIIVKYISLKTCLEIMGNNLTSDCSLVYSTNDNREIQKVYWNNIQFRTGIFEEYKKREKSADEKREDAKREILINDMTPLTTDLENGNTVNIIMSIFSSDYIYKKVQNTDMFCLTIIEYDYRVRGDILDNEIKFDFYDTYFEKNVNGNTGEAVYIKDEPDEVMCMFYKKYPEFTINGTTFQYVIEKYDTFPELLAIKSENNDIKKEFEMPTRQGEKIARNLNIFDEVYQMKPSRNRSPDDKLKSIITVDFLSTDNFLTSIKDNMDGHCWLVYLTDDLREPKKIYFNQFKNNVFNEYDENENIKRKKLRKNIKQILSDLESGYTLHVIINFFKTDYIYKKIPNNEMFSLITVRHAIRADVKKID